MPKTYSVKETAELFGVSQGTIYKAVKKEQIPYVRLGTRIVIPRHYVDSMVVIGDNTDKPCLGSPQEV